MSIVSLNMYISIVLMNDFAGGFYYFYLLYHLFPQAVALNKLETILSDKHSKHNPIFLCLFFITVYLYYNEKYRFWSCTYPKIALI